MKKTTLIGIGASLMLAAATAAADIKVGFIGSLSSDTGLSTCLLYTSPSPRDRG